MVHHKLIEDMEGFVVESTMMCHENTEAFVFQKRKGWERNHRV